MRRLAIGIFLLAGLTAGCETGAMETQERRTHTEVQFGNGKNPQLDRGVPEGSSTNPQVENGLRPH